MDTFDNVEIEIVYDSKITGTKTSDLKEIKLTEAKPEGGETDAFEFIDLPDEVYPEYMR
jgi:hypothetical protein